MIFSHTCSQHVQMKKHTDAHCMTGNLPRLVICIIMTWLSYRSYSYMGHDHYPMTSVKISGEMDCWETPSDPHSNGSWDISKNPYLLRYHIIPNLARILAFCSYWSGGLCRPTGPGALHSLHDEIDS